MKLVTAKARAGQRLRSRDIAELAVMVRFGQLVVALPAMRVARIVTDEDAVPITVRSTPHIQIGDEVYPAWDIGPLMGFSDPPQAWILMTTSDEPGAPTVAIGTGPCLAVTTHDDPSPLPAGVVTGPPAAFVGVFPTDAALRERGVGHLGVRLDPMRLIGASALAAARRGER